MLGQWQDPGIPVRSPGSVFLGRESRLRSAGIELLSAAKSRCSWQPAPAKPGVAFVPHSRGRGWASDLGVEARGSWQCWEG